MFAGRSVGDLSVTAEADQSLVYRVLAEEGFTGVVAVHCEKESEMHPELWNPKIPVSHCRARPPEAEYASVLDQINFSGEVGFKGYLHIPHVSTNLSVHAVVEARKQGRKISMGVTPHHLLFSDERMMQPDGILYKVNPPLRDAVENMLLMNYLRDGAIDWIETDHAPHTFAEKTGKVLDEKGNPKYDSGIPSLVFYPRLIEVLVQNGFSQAQLDRITHTNIENVFGISLPKREIPSDVRRITLELANEYEFFKGNFD
jgi:dihydroorotase